MGTRNRRTYRSLIDLEVMRELAGERLATVLVAVSGGADSVALLMALYEVREELGLRLEVVHLDHGLRDESVDDCKFVQGLCDGLGLTCIAEVLEKKQRPGGASPEAYWRERRYEYFSRVYKERGADAIALGHTLDDMAETFLYHLARGTGAKGAKFDPIKEVRDMRIVRPMGRTSRKSIEDVLTVQGQEWREDVSNLDTRYSRNLIRHRVMPALREINPDVCGAIARFCDHVGTSAEESESTFEELPEKLKLRDLMGYDNGVRGRLLRPFIGKNAGQLPTFRQMEQGLGMLANGKYGLVSLSASHTLVIDQVHVWVYPGNEPTDEQLATRVASCEKRVLAHIDGTVVFGEKTARLRLLTGQEISIPGILPGACGVRNRKEGDKVGSRLLKKLLIDKKVSWYLRDYLVFYVNEKDEIVGLLGNEDLGVV